MIYSNATLFQKNNLIHYNNVCKIKNNKKCMAKCITKCILPNSIPQISVPSSPSIEYITPLKDSIKTIQTPLLNAPALQDNNDWNYTSFIYKVLHNEVESVKITQDQKYISVKLKNNNEHNLILPEGYDIISFLVQYNIPIYIQPIKKPPVELSVLDITLIICQCVFLYYVVSTIMSKKVKITNDDINLTTLSSFTNNKSTINDNVNDLEVTAYRESGKLISNLFTNEIDNIDSVSITDNKSTTEEYNVATNKKQDRQYLENRLKIILGGRVAEEIIFGALRSSSGKSTDIEIAIQLAYDIIATFGFSQSIGITEWDNLNTPHIQKKLERIVKRIIIRSYRDIRKIIIKNKELLDIIAKELLDKKTLYKEDIRELLLKTYKNTRKFNNKLLKHLNTKNIKSTYNNNDSSTE